MENKQFKNMIVLKNLPSNIIEEAIVILKENNKIEIPKQLEKNKQNIKCKQNTREYIIKEAELVISNYITNIEKKRTEKRHKDIEEKYKRTKTLSIFLIILFILQFISRIGFGM